jgi:hypothetical protein
MIRTSRYVHIWVIRLLLPLLALCRQPDGLPSWDVTVASDNDDADAWLVSSSLRLSA